MTTLERITLRRKLEKSERVEQLDARTRDEMFKLAEQTADGPDTIETNYKRIARVVRLAFKRGQDFEADRQWRQVV